MTTLRRPRLAAIGWVPYCSERRYLKRSVGVRPSGEMTEGPLRIPPPLLAAIGAAAGVLSGLLGVGGGIVMVPALVIAGLGQHRAQATSLAAIVPIAVVGAIFFGRAASVDYVAAVVLAVGSVVGVRIGALLMHRLSEALLARVFGVFMIVFAVTMLVR
jgi:uncharacterized protein